MHTLFQSPLIGGTIAGSTAFRVVGTDDLFARFYFETKAGCHDPRKTLVLSATGWNRLVELLQQRPFQECRHCGTDQYWVALEPGENGCVTIAQPLTGRKHVFLAEEWRALKLWAQSQAIGQLSLPASQHLHS